MHKNARFNIVQAAGNCNPLFNVIDGQRSDSGHKTSGARLLGGPAMPRDEAIALADKLQTLADVHTTAVRAAKWLPDAKRHEALEEADLAFEDGCFALGAFTI